VANTEDLPVESRAIVEAVDRLTAAIESLHQDWKTDPQRAIGEIMLQNLKAQMGGGILAAGGILKPGH
jgi:hypothetical protein